MQALRNAAKRGMGGVGTVMGGVGNALNTLTIAAVDLVCDYLSVLLKEMHSCPAVSGQRSLPPRGATSCNRYSCCWYSIAVVMIIKVAGRKCFSIIILIILL